MNCHYHPDVPSAAFCQFCGKPLCKDCIRNVGGAVYCEACLAERLRAAGAPAPAAFSTGTPHPMLAGLLGFIPGVGAMYNGQYAKAIAHVIIFAVLASLSDHSGIFGILVAAWVFYQVFDAYQTALARRDGLPLPNPFGLNDIAQRLGLHPHPGMAGAPPIPPVPPVAPAAATGWEPVSGTPPPAPGATPAGAAPFGAAGFVPPVGAPYAGQPGYTGYTPGYTSGYTAPSGYPPAPGQPYASIPPYGQIPAGRDLPVGAIILIGLGILFLFSSLGLLHGIWIGHLWPLLIIGLGVWIIVRRTRTLPPAGLPPTDPSMHAETRTAERHSTDKTGGMR